MKDNIFILWIFAFVFSTTLFGCFDIFKEKQEPIIGNISAINSNDGIDRGYTLVIYNNILQVNENIIPEYLISLYGNDSLMFVKSMPIDSSEDMHYYQLEHKKGTTIIRTDKIDSLTFAEHLTNQNYLYKFEFDSLLVTKR